MAGPSYKIIHAFHHVYFSIIIFAFQQWSEHSAVAYVRKTNDEFWCAGEWWKKKRYIVGSTRSLPKKKATEIAMLVCLILLAIN